MSVLATVDATDMVLGDCSQSVDQGHGAGYPDGTALDSLTQISCKSRELVKIAIGSVAIA
jgi:hypothetical protein